MNRPLEKMRSFFCRKNNLFFLLLGIQIAFFLFMSMTRRVPDGHDGWEYLAQQYVFLNNAVFSYEIPQWMPYLTHGMISSWFFAVSAGLLQNVLFLIAPLLKGINFLFLFHLGMFVDELVLLVGTWLLARRIFQSPITVFFVSSSVLGSCVWMNQVWFSFHFTYALPMLLFLGHAFFDTGQWKNFFIASILLALQCFGNLPYYLPVISGFIFLYFACYFLADRVYLRESLSRVKVSGFGVFCFFFLLFLLFAFYRLISIGADQITFLSRSTQGTLDVASFLKYCQRPLSCWFELLLGISPGMDLPFYVGLLPLGFAALGILFHPSRNKVAFLVPFLVMAAFSAASPLASAAYYIWPGMKYYRHIGYLIIFCKLFLCFLSGFGVELLLDQAKACHWRKFLRPACGIVATAFFILGAVLLLISSRHEEMISLFQQISGTFSVRFFEHLANLCQGSWVDGFPEAVRVIYTKDFLAIRLFVMAGIAAAAGILFSFWFFVRSARARAVLIYALLFLGLIDIFGYRLVETRIRTIALSAEQTRIFDFQRSPYCKRRSLVFPRENPRAELLRDISPSYAVRKWLLNSFLFQDTAGSAFFAAYWLLPFDRFLRAVWDQPIDDRSYFPKGVIEGPNSFKFPSGRASIRKIAGIDDDKVQFFDKAYRISDQDLAAVLRREDFSGDVLFVSGENRPVGPKSLRTWTSQDHVVASDRKKCPYQILRFDANHFDLEVICPPHQGAWLFYADLWHPLWRVTVNGRRSDLWRADLAYKAVFLDPGKNIVRFSFGSWEVVLYQIVFCLLSLGFIFFLFKTVVALLRSSSVPGLGLEINRKILLAFCLVSVAITWGIDYRIDQHLRRPRTQDLLRYLNRFSQGQEPYRQKEFVRGQSLYKRLTGVSLQKALTLANYGFCSFYAGDLNEATAAYRAAIEHDNRFHSFSYDLGMVMLEIRQYRQALAFFEMSLPLAIREREYYEVFKQKILETDNESESLYNDILALLQQVDKDIEHLYVLRIDGYRYFQDFPSMTQACFLGLSEYPHSSALLLRLGLAQMISGRLDEAGKIFDSLAQVDPGYEKEKIDRLKKLCDLQPSEMRDALVQQELRQGADFWGEVHSEGGKLHFFGQQAALFLFQYSTAFGSGQKP